MKDQKCLKIMNVVGARPNFMKIAPIMEEMNKSSLLNPVLLHTGQHYDEKMSKLFFEDLGIPKPDIELEVGSGSHAVQTAQIMERFELILIKEKPDLILVVGDVNSTLACAITAAKLCIPVAHVEAGLRSFDRTMPEEINRVLTDAISDILFITEKSANKNLLKEGIAKDKIFFVGNVMIDTLLKQRAKAEKSGVLSRFGLVDSSGGTQQNIPVPYAVLTLHRPSNVDTKEQLNGILKALSAIAKELPVVFPAHPRTRKRISDFGLDHYFSSDFLKSIDGPGIFLIEPLGYLDFMNLMANSRLVLTDSGGMQEETTVLGIPCITLRDSTERPVTVTEGTNKVVGTDSRKIVKAGLDAINKSRPENRIPELWDGKAATRIVEILVRIYQSSGTEKKAL